MSNKSTADITTYQPKGFKELSLMHKRELDIRIDYIGSHIKELTNRTESLKNELKSAQINMKLAALDLDLSKINLTSDSNVDHNQLASLLKNHSEKVEELNTLHTDKMKASIDMDALIKSQVNPRSSISMRHELTHRIALLDSKISKVAQQENSLKSRIQAAQEEIEHDKEYDKDFDKHFLKMVRRYKDLAEESNSLDVKRKNIGHDLELIRNERLAIDRVLKRKLAEIERKQRLLAGSTVISVIAVGFIVGSLRAKAYGIFTFSVMLAILALVMLYDHYALENNIPE